MRINIFFPFLIFIAVFANWACKKSTSSADDPIVISNPDSTATNPPSYKLSYGDSIFYLKNQSSDYIVYPTEARAGNYIAFPDGIELDKKTGAINVSKSETGLRYRISYINSNNDTSSTMVTLSGINYLDQFYHLSKGDSVAFPIYNDDASKNIPCNNGDCSFDEGNNANSVGCAVKTTNGQINLAETVRNGFFGKKPKSNARFEVEFKYRLNDDSKKALNSIKVKLYYYETINDVSEDLKKTLQEHEGTILRVSSTSNVQTSNRLTQIARPRPPCIIVLQQ